MRLVRAETDDGIIEGEYRDGEIHTDEDVYAEGDEAELLPPCDPSIFYCAGRTYQDYIELTGNEAPEKLHFFLKPPVSVFPPFQEIPHPSFSEKVGYAGELAAVIDRDCHNISPEDVPDYVRGYTILNDLSALDGVDSAKKVFNFSAPIGPWIETDIDPHGLAMKTTIGGEVRQEGNTNEMLMDPFEIVSYLSTLVSLQSDDVIAFGSPANPGHVEPGETIKMWYEGIGTLENTLGEKD